MRCPVLTKDMPVPGAERGSDRPMDADWHDVRDKMDVKVYTKEGPARGYETTPEAWTVRRSAVFVESCGLWFVFYALLWFAGCGLFQIWEVRWGTGLAATGTPHHPINNDEKKKKRHRTFPAPAPKQKQEQTTTN
eukprot:698744-Rhodomonas_salina.1